MSLVPSEYAGDISESWSSSWSNPNNDLTYQWMQEANAFNAKQAEINRKFQERMSNTAYERAMRDMERSGLNPILAGNLGGASTPAGNAAQANFTGAGATSGSSSYAYSQSQSIKESAYNLAMKTINGTLDKTFHGDVNQLATYLGNVAGDAFNWLKGRVQEATTNNSQIPSKHKGPTKVHYGKEIDSQEDIDKIVRSRHNAKSKKYDYDSRGKYGYGDDDPHIGKVNNQLMENWFPEGYNFE